MTDLKKVITPLNVATNSIRTTVPNYVKSPEGDRPVFYSRTGFLDLDYRPTISGQFISSITTAAQSRAASTAPIVEGLYFSTTGTLNPCDLDPRRRIIIGDQNSSTTFTLTFPSPQDHINYLKSVFGTENITAGFSWSTKYINWNGPGENATLRINTPAAAGTNVYTFGFQGSGPALRQVNGLNAVPNYNSCTIEFIVTDITVGTEAMTYISD